MASALLPAVCAAAAGGRERNPADISACGPPPLQERRASQGGYYVTARGAERMAAHTTAPHFRPPWLSAGEGGRDMGLLELCAKQTDEALAAGAGGDVHYDPQSRTFDCAPSLTDSQVLDFCRTGVIVLPGVVVSPT